MTLHYGERVPSDGTLRCTRCGHGIALLGGDSVPRCYCGGDAFDHTARAYDAHTPRPSRPPDAGTGDGAYRDQRV